MAVDIDKNNRIAFPRGEDFSAPLFLNKGTDLKPIRHILSDGENIYLSIMEPNKPFEDGIIRKVFTKDNLNQFGDVLIEITHDDTRCLLPGKYFYQIKGELFDPRDKKLKVNTVVQKTEL